MDVAGIINQMGVLFILLIVGYAIYKLKVIDEEMNKKLSSLCLKVTCPALVLGAVASSGQQGDPQKVLLVFAISVGLYVVFPLLGWALARLLRVPKEDRALYQFMTIFSNVGNMGFPVILAIFGREAIIYSSVFNLAFNIFVYTLGVRLMSPQDDAHFDYKKLVNPGTVACLLALILYFTGLQLPKMLTDVLDSLGSMTAPLSMLIIGASLASIPMKEVFREVRLYPYTLIKQLVFPVALFFILRLFLDDPVMLGTIVVVSAMPVAATTVMFANQYGGNTALATKGIFLTTLASVATIPLLVYFMVSML